MTSIASDPSPLLILFARGVIARLATWSTLTIAVSSSWGGPSSSAKRTWLASEIVDAFEKSWQDGEDEIWVEEMLLQVMEDEFNTGIEDDSAMEVAKDIVKLWQLLSQPSHAQEGQKMIDELSDRADKLRGKKIDMQIQDETLHEDEDGDWTDEDDDDLNGSGDEVPQLVPHKHEPVIDEDGFTLVQGKSKKG